MPRKIAHDDPTRLYENDFIERLTRAHPSEPFWIFTLPALLLLYAFAKYSPHSWLMILPYFAIGVLVWTLTEYTLHRFLFHLQATTDAGKKVMRLIHGIHHEFPNDTDRLVIPPMTSIPVSFIFAATYFAIGGLWIMMPLLAGSLVGYMVYDFIHYATHHIKPRTPLGRIQRRRHLLHHYKYPQACFGVSTSLWDWVFGTTEHDAKRAVEAGKMQAYADSNWKIIDNDIS